MEWAVDRIGVVDERVFFAARGASLATWPAHLELASPYFVCLVIADGDAENTDEVVAWASRALAQGMVCCSAWGPGCEVVHDVVGWEVLKRDQFRTDTSPILTTWHPDESLAQAMAFFVNSVIPAAAYQAECRSWLLVEAGAFGQAFGSRKTLVQLLKDLAR